MRYAATDITDKLDWEKSVEWDIFIAKQFNVQTPPMVNEMQNHVLVLTIFQV